MAVLGTDRVSCLKLELAIESPRPRPLRALVYCVCGPALSLFVTLQAHCDIIRPVNSGSLEYRVKSAFLFNFAKFVEWPKESFENENSPIVIGVLGKDPFGPLLESTVRGKTVQNRPIVIKRFKSVKTLKPCHLLFVSSSENERLKGVFAALKDACALTVGETERFARDGGIVSFKMRAKKVRFEINVDAVKRTKLRISSKLLQLADIVRDSPDKRDL